MQVQANKLNLYRWRLFARETGGKQAKQSEEVKVKVGLVQDKNEDRRLTKVKSRTITIAVFR